ncbi:hypothetical protein CVT25_013007 [Psilocybe cyanescens]|uniref:Uncharacterized protein n=1 Tax=Psilocybe cyanescens TaxID=93625 RepID=A0A409XHM3_PSICY|nr:hypothetical protein CVT25_013007 [Psilocybe cyanescens]
MDSAAGTTIKHEISDGIMHLECLIFRVVVALQVTRVIILPYTTVLSVAVGAVAPRLIQEYLVKYELILELGGQFNAISIAKISQEF